MPERLCQAVWPDPRRTSACSRRCSSARSPTSRRSAWKRSSADRRLFTCLRTRASRISATWSPGASPGAFVSSTCSLTETLRHGSGPSVVIVVLRCRPMCPAARSHEHSRRPKTIRRRARFAGGSWRRCVAFSGPRVPARSRGIHYAERFTGRAEAPFGGFARSPKREGKGQAVSAARRLPAPKERGPVGVACRCLPRGWRRPATIADR